MYKFVGHLYSDVVEVVKKDNERTVYFQLKVMFKDFFTDYQLDDVLLCKATGQMATTILDHGVTNSKMVVLGIIQPIHYRDKKGHVYTRIYVDVKEVCLLSPHSRQIEKYIFNKK